jgi:hypothetical protein
MPGLVPGIHVLLMSPESKTWMAGTSPAMTIHYVHLAVSPPSIGTSAPVMKAAASDNR